MKKKILIFISKKKKNIFISCINITKNLFNIINIFSLGTFNLLKKKKKEFYLLMLLINKIIFFLINLKFKNCILIFKGVNNNKKNIIKLFKKTIQLKRNLNIIFIKDITKYPYNGCKKKKFFK